MTLTTSTIGYSSDSWEFLLFYCRIVHWFSRWQQCSTELSPGT